MEKKINIAELLKDCPKGMELDCSMFENLEFDYVDELIVLCGFGSGLVGMMFGVVLGSILFSV